MAAHLLFGTDFSQWQPWLSVAGGLVWAGFVFLAVRVLLGGSRRRLPRSFLGRGSKQWRASEPHIYGSPNDFAYQVEQMWK